MTNTAQLYTRLTMMPKLMPHHYAEVLVMPMDLTIAVRPGQDVFINVGDQYNYFAPRHKMHCPHPLDDAIDAAVFNSRVV